MALNLSNRDGGLTNEEGHYRFQTKVWEGNVLSGLQVTPSSPAGLSVTVSTGDAKIDYADYGYTLWNDSNAVVPLDTADPSNPRIDRIVLYIDRGETPQQVTPNNPGIPKLMAVKGTPAGSPTRPSDSAVNSAVGAGNPWTNLADVLIPTGSSTITTGITDTRVWVRIPDNRLVISTVKWSGWAATNFGTTETTLGTVNVAVPINANKLRISGSVRMQSMSSGNLDMRSYVRDSVNTLNRTYTMTATSTAQFSSAMNALEDIIDAVPDTTMTLQLRANTSTGLASSNVGAILITPIYQP